jgi:ElaB/YqjD/DUF883 family membrane-anchored ribosome-binding protein
MANGSTNTGTNTGGEVNGVRSRVDQEDYDSPAANSPDNILRPSTLDYESTDRDTSLSTAADDEELMRSAGTVRPVADTDAADTPDDDIAATRAQIEQTRAEMSSTIDQIKDRLSPAHLMEEAKEATVGAAGHAVHSAVDSVKDTASGVIDTVKDKASAIVEAVKDKASSAVDAVKGAAHTVADKVHPSSHSGGETASSPSITYYDRTSLAYGSTSNTNLGATIVDSIKVNPLPAAIAGFGLGWLLISIQRQNSSSARAYRSGGSNYGDYNGAVYPEYRDSAPGETYASGSYTGNTYGGSTYSGSSTYGSGSTYGTSGTYGTTGDTGTGLRDRASDIASTVTDKASGLASTVTSKASDLASTVTGTASNVAHTVTDKASDLAHTVGDKASDIKERAGQLASDVRYRAGDLAHGARERAGDIADTTRVQYRAAADNVDTFINEQPLVAGAAALLVGAAIGYLIPSTSKENQILGPKRDRLFDQAGEAVQNVATKVQGVAETALGQARESLANTVDQAKEQLSDTVAQTKDQLSHTVDQAKESLSETVKETKNTAKKEAKNKGLDSPTTAIS